jgi:transcriptional regulator with XRE-family HTH domain
MNQVRKRIPTPIRRKPAVKTPGAPIPLPKPNIADPLSEPTRHRRVWAAYLAAGLTRREFAERLGTNYHTVNRWDAGAAVMSLDMLERAVSLRLVHYSMDQLCFGRAAAPSLGTEPARARELPLAEADIRALFDAQRVDPATRAAFGEHAVSPAGRYQTFTASYVEAWCAAYAATRDETQALQAAVGQRAATEAVAAGVGSVSTDALRAALRGKA